MWCILRVLEFGSFPPPVMLGQSCHLSADFGFRRHKFLIFFLLLLSLFQGCLKVFGCAWESDSSWNE